MPKGKRQTREYTDEQKERLAALKAEAKAIREEGRVKSFYDKCRKAAVAIMYDRTTSEDAKKKKLAALYHEVADEIEESQQ